MFTFAADYFIGVFVSTLGALQFAAARAGLRAMLIVRPPALAKALGAALSAGGLALFFATGERNINDYEGGLDGPAQALFFFYGAAAALAVTLASSSLVNRRMRGADCHPSDGLDCLKHTNYALALARGVRRWRENWRTRTRRSFWR